MRKPLYAIYTHYATDGTCLYVGASADPFRRQLAHRSRSGWWADVARVEVQLCDSAEEAAQRELEAIKSLAPVHNRAGVTTYDMPYSNAPSAMALGLAGVEGEWMTAQDAAEILNVHPRTVIRWAENGRIRVTKSGPARTNPWLINRADVEALAQKAGTR